MDRELKDYLDRLERHVDARFEENRQHLERHVDARFEENRQHLERHVDARFEENRQRLEHHVDARFEDLEGKIRQTHVMVEDVRGLVQTVAEGVVAVGERQERSTEELKEEIGEVRDLLTTSYRYLDRRLPVPEGRA